MRLPRAKLHRAFPELDPYTDFECRRYMREASERRIGRGIILMLAGVVVGLVVGIGGPIVWGKVAHTLSLIKPGADKWLWELLIVDSVRILGFVGGPSAGFFLARDFWLRRAVRARLDTAKCGGCGYSLLGLTVVRDPATGDDSVQCPECGQMTPLRSAGLTRSDLMDRGTARSAPPTESPLTRG